MNQKWNIEIYTKEWCPYCRRAKAFLKSKGLDFVEYSIDQYENKKEMLKRSGGAKTVPQIFIDDIHIGGHDDLIRMETSGQLEEKFGIPFQDYSRKPWDLIIIGAGPAGLSAAVYAARKGIDLLLLSGAMGGQVLETDSIDNYIGKQNIKGADLMTDFWEHARQYEVPSTIGEEITGITRNEELNILETASGREYRTKTVIVATGTHKRHLGVDGENQLKGKGVHYCAICDGYLYAGQPVVVVGGGNSGLEAALDMAKLDSQVYLVEIMEELMGDEYLQKQVKNNEKIEIYTSCGVKEIKGKEKLTSVLIENKENMEEIELDVEALFVEIGLIPNSDFTGDLIEKNDRKEIIIDENNKTSLEGVWAAGDVTDIKDKQIIVATAEGAKSALRVNEYLNK